LREENLTDERLREENLTMVHSVELLFDADTEAAIRRVWEGLAEAGIRSQASVKAQSSRPHVTMTVAEEMDDDVDEALRPVLERLPLRCQVGAPMLFGRGPFTLVRLVVPSVELLAIQAEAYRICLPYMPSGPLPHADPGGWTPHVTLARRVESAQLATAMAVRRVARDINGAVAGLRHWDGNKRIEHHIGE
jgi:hypothetical protein